MVEPNPTRAPRKDIETVDFSKMVELPTDKGVIKVLNVASSPFVFRFEDEDFVVEPSGAKLTFRMREIRVNADEEGKPDIIYRLYGPTEAGRKRYKSIKEREPSVYLIGTSECAQAYRGQVLEPVSIRTDEHVPIEQRRMDPSRLRTYESFLVDTEDSWPNVN